MRRLTIGVLYLWLSVLALGLLPPSTVRADHTVQAPVQRVFPLTFATSGQNVWGPGAGDSPTSTRYDFFNETWNESDSVRDIQEFAGMEFGGSIGGHTSGRIGMGAKFLGFSAGGVSVNYPVDITLSTPPIDSFRAGQTVTIGSNFVVKPGASLNVANSSGDIELVGTFAFSAGANAEVCFFDCSGNIPVVPTITIPEQDGKIISVSELASLCGFAVTSAPGTSTLNTIYPAEGCEITPQMAYLSNLPFTGKVGIPNIQFSTVLEADGKTLRTSGTHANFMNLEIDLTGIFSAISDQGLGVSFPPLIPGVTAEANVFTSTANVRISQSQTVRFAPVIEGRLEIPASSPAVPFTVKTPGGAVVTSGTGRLITFDVGNNVEITIPAGVAPGTYADLVPTFSMKPTGHFSNDVNTTFATDLDSDALSVEFGTPSVEVVPSFELFPEVCWPWPIDECSSAVWTPAVVAPEISVGLGPVWSHTEPIYAGTDSTLFDRNVSPWSLGGFTASSVTGFQLNPQYTPVVSIAGPSQLNEAQVGAYTFTFSDADGDPLTYTVDWGDGAVATGTGNPAGTTVNLNHAYVDNGTYTVKLTVSDGHKIKGETTLVVTVANVAPVLSGISLTATLNEEGVATISGVITDPGLRDSFTMEVNWGGPSGQQEGIDTWTLPAGSTAFTRSHKYTDDNPTATAADGYTVTVKVTDKDSGTDTKTANTTVNNVVPTIYAGSDRVVDEGSPTALGVELFGTNLVRGANAEEGMADWTATGGLTTRRYRPAGTVDPTLVVLATTGGSNPTQGYYNQSIGNSLNGTQTQFPGPVPYANYNLYNSWTGVNLTSNVSCLTDYGMNDAVSTVYVASGSIRLWQHCPYYGFSMDLGPGWHTLDSWWAGNLSSIQVLSTATPDPDLGTSVAEPNLSSVSGALGGWLSANPSLNANWSGLTNIPGTWPEFHETAVIYPIDVPPGGATLKGYFHIDNGIFVWVDGQYKFGAVQPGGPPTSPTQYEYQNINLGFYPEGRHYVQVIREDHGGVTGWNFEIRGELTPEGGLNLDSPGPAKRGSSYFGAESGTGSAQQVLNVASISDLVDGAKVLYDFSAWLGGAVGQGDNATVTATFRNGSGGTIATATLGPVSAADRGSVTKLLERHAAGDLPVGTRTVLITVTAAQTAGTTNQAGAENLSFILLPKPGAKATAGFVDTGLKDAYTTSVTWGDSTPAEVPVVTGVPGNNTINKSHIYGDNGAYTVTASVTDDDTGAHSHAFTATVRNVPPAVTGIEQIYLLGRSETKQLVSFSDPGAWDTHTVSINWGDGTPASAGTVTESLGNTPGVRTTGTAVGTHTYNVSGPFPRVYTAQVTVTDKDGGATTVPVRITVSDLEIPGGSLSASPASLNEGGSVAFSGGFSGIVFPPGATTFTPTYDFTLDYGDGTPPATGAASPGTAINRSHTYSQNGTYTAVLTVRAWEGSRLATLTTIPRVITVANLAPAVAAVANKSVTEGGTASFSTTFTDAGVQDVQTASMNWGDGSAVETLGVVAGAGSGSVAGSHQYRQDGSYTATLTVRDDDSAAGTRQFTVTVGNAAPTVNAGADQAVTEGSPVAVLATFGDAGPLDTHTATINWGDGVTEPGVVDQAGDTVAGSHLYANNGTYTVTVCVKDDDTQTCDALTAVVANAAPTVGAVGNQSADEGDAVSFSATYADLGPNDTHTATVDWGDGSVEGATVNPAAGTVSGSHTYRQNGSYTVTVNVADADGGVGSRSFAVTVQNVAPAVEAGPNVTVYEGAAVALAPASFSDPGTLDSHSAQIDWGDGAVEPGLVDAAADTVAGTHAYADNGTYTVEVCVTDDGATACDTFRVTVLNLAPVVEAGADQSVVEGDTVVVTPAVSDAGSADVVTTVIDWGDGTVTQGASGSHAYADNGIYLVTVCATDDDGAQTCDTLTVTAASAPPAVSAGADQAAAEGSMVSVAAGYTDPGTADTHTATIDWGDGVVVHAAAAGGAVAGSHAYADNGVYTVTVCVRDDDRDEGCDTLTVTVSNVAPDVNAGPDRTVDQGSRLGLNPATFTDPGTADTHTATVNWGDGSSSAATVNEAAGVILASHSYADVGTYTVTVCITDKDGASDCDEMSVRVLNVAPAVHAGGDAAVTEGEPFMQSGPFAATVYQSGFDSGSDPAWTVAGSTLSPNGERFLGQLGAEAAVLNLTNLPAHNQVTITFDLYLINSWDGNGNYCCGPDIFEVGVVDGPTLLRTSFSNTGPLNLQSYPAAYPGPDQPGGTGALQVNSLGYGSDSTYRLTFTVPHTESSIAFKLLALNLQGLGDESWGIDNVVVSVPVIGPTFADPGVSETWTATVDYGDGTGVAPLALGADRRFALNHVYADDGAYTVTVTVTDSHGATGVDSLVVTVANVAPAVEAGPDQAATEGSTVSLAPATFNDLGTLDAHTAVVDWGDGTGAQPAVVTESPFGPPGSVDGASGSVAASHVYADDGVYTVTVTVTDDNGGTTSDSFTVTVGNVAPSVDAGPDVTASEGSVVALAPSTFNDLGTLDTHTATVDWGDGTGVQPAAVTESPFGPPGSLDGASGSVAASHVYADDGVYTVTVTVTDDNGGTTSDSFTVTVGNVAPSVDAGPDVTASEGSVVALAPATFNDLGTLDTHTAVVDWGDGTGAQPAVVTESPFGPPGSTAGADGSVAASHVYADDGVYTVTVTVTDDDGASTSDSFTVTVGNVAPTVEAGPDVAASEGSVVALAPSTFNDLGTLDAHTATVDWGDGTGAQAAVVTESPVGPPGSTAGADGSVAASHVYADDGVYTVTVTVTDDDGASTSDTFVVTVGNVVPSVDAGPDVSATEGSTVSLAPSTFNDLGTLDIHTATVDWGDGTGAQAAVVTESPFGPPGSTAGAGGLVAASHVYADDGVYTVTVTVTDDDGGVTSDTLVVTVGNVAPSVDAGPDVTASEGHVVSLAPSTFNDLGTLDTHTATVDWGDGTGAQAAVVTESPFGPPGSTAGADGSVAANHVYADDGVYTVTVTVTDDNGGSTSDSFTVTVGNEAPTVNAGANLTVNEASPISLQGAGFNDLGTLDTHTASLDWGDGTGAQPATVTESPFGPPGSTSGANGNVAASHVYADNGTYTATVTVTDDDGSATNATTVVTVLNVAPTVNAGPDGWIYSGQSHTVNASFTDPSLVDTHTATIDWGDGSALEPAPVNQGAGSGTVTLAHRYLVPQFYTVTVCVTDDDGGMTCDQLQVEVKRLPVGINVKPGSSENPVNLNSKVPVAILTTQAGEYGLPEPFNATEIDVPTVRFGPLDVLVAGGGSAEKHGRGHTEDALERDETTRDGDLDMVIHFDVEGSGITESTTSVCVRGVTTGGVWFEACDAMHVVPEAAPAGSGETSEPAGSSEPAPSGDGGGGGKKSKP